MSNVIRDRFLNCILYFIYIIHVMHLKVDLMNEKIGQMGFFFFTVVTMPRSIWILRYEYYEQAAQPAVHKTRFS